MAWKIIERTETTLVLRDRPWLGWAFGALLAGGAVLFAGLLGEASVLRLDRMAAGNVGGSLVRRGLFGTETIVIPPGTIVGTTIEWKAGAFDHTVVENDREYTVRVHGVLARVLIRTKEGDVPLLRRFRSGGTPGEDAAAIDGFLQGRGAGTLLLDRDGRLGPFAVAVPPFLLSLLCLGLRSLTVVADRNRGGFVLAWRGPWLFSRVELAFAATRGIWVNLGPAGMAWLSLETKDGIQVPFRRVAFSQRRNQEEAAWLLRGFLPEPPSGSASPTAPCAP